MTQPKPSGADPAITEFEAFQQGVNLTQAHIRCPEMQPALKEFHAAALKFEATLGAHVRSCQKGGNA